MKELQKTARTAVRRLPARGSYDLETIQAILDEGLVAHVGFAVEGRPFVIPMTYGRAGDRLYLHGSSASRLLRSLAGGVDVCATVTLFDGLVLARSVFHHSMNYRSVVLFGAARLIADPDAKLAALRTITEHIVPGRWAEARLPNETEMKATSVLELPILEASAKIRTGGPKDEPEDMDFPVWAGHVDFHLDPTAVHEDGPQTLARPHLDSFRRPLAREL